MTSAITFESTQKTAQVDGVKFNYHEAGEGVPLILLHGSGPGVTAWSNFGPNLPFFADTFRTIMPDLPGFGLTDLPELDEIYTIAAARWIAKFMDHLGIESAVFVGNSMGGAVVAELAALHPERVQRQAIMGSGGMSVGIFQAEPSEGFLRLFEFLEDPVRDRMIAWIKTMVYDKALITDELVDQRLTNALADGVLGKTKTIFGTLFNPAFRTSYVPLWTKAETLKTPTLLLWGRDDRMIPYDQAHFATRWLPEVELHTFAHCGHWIQVERKADFERVVHEFLTRHTA